MEESLKKAKLSATISPYLRAWMLDRVNNKDFVSTRKINIIFLVVVNLLLRPGPFYRAHGALPLYNLLL